jgi:hypothetical protein
MSIIREYYLKQENQLDVEFDIANIYKHHANTGENREEIIRRWLEKHIPKTVTAEMGGKIIDSDGNISKQVDLVIYDTSVPRFGSQTKTYFLAEGVMSAIEVKSTLAGKELKAAVENLSSVRDCKQKFGAGIFHGNPNIGITTGIFAYHTKYSSSQSIITALKRLEDLGVPPVNFVYVNKKCYIAYNPGNWAAMDEHGKPLDPLPKGYVVIENKEGCIWRLVLTIASETKRVVSSTPDFQRYFLNKDLLPST